MYSHVALIGADLQVTQVEKVMAFCHQVFVEQNFLGGIKGEVLAAVNVVFLALFRAGIVPIIAVAVGDGAVILFDSAQHFFIEAVLQGLGVVHDRFRIGVFSR
jgi:hypothetical protein